MANPVTAAKSERLLNLVILLLVARNYTTKEQIRALMEPYRVSTDEAFDRMFERDKDDLRALGIPLEVGFVDKFFEDEQGYRIKRDAFELPQVELEPDEAAVAGLAARVWQHAGLADATSQALLKLKAAGLPVDREALDVVQPRLVADEPAFDAVWAATQSRTPVAFDYRRRGLGEPTRRHVQPWGVVAWHGRWYLVGLDLDRQAPRQYRLSRVVGTPKATGPAGAFEPPADLDLAEVVARQVGGQEQLVVVRARPGTAIGLRRHAVPLGPADDGDDRLELRTTEPGALADQIAAYGDGVLVEAPAEVRDAVISRLTRLAAMGETA